MQTQRLITVAALALVFAGCTPNDPDKQDSSEATTPNRSDTLELKLASAENSEPVTLSFTLPPGQQAYQSTVSLSGSPAGPDSAMSEWRDIIAPPDIGRYQAVTPHPELFCDKDANADLVSLAEQLGGYKKGVNIKIEHDAASPTLLSGFQAYRYGGLEANAMSDSSGVTIQRPNSIARKGNLAFYLSDVYGLVMLKFDEGDAKTVDVACALPLPGKPSNFVVSGSRLIVLLKSMDQRSAGLIQLDFSAAEQSTTAQLTPPTVIDTLFFEHHSILDARLFNQTLALYLKSYQLPEHADTDYAASAVANMRIPSYVQPWQTAHYTLQVINTQASFDVLHTQIFRPEVTGDTFDEGESWHTSFNDFLSASGEYLIVTQGNTHRYITHHETRYAYRCTESKINERPYQYCSTKWLRINNPDYKPTPSGVMNCQASLRECINQQLPSTSRYLFKADGQECFSGVRTISRQCVTGQYEQYSVPQFKTDRSTDFHVFRFNAGEFQKLDNTLAEVVDDTNIKISDRPFRLSGRVQKHDHMNFQGNQLYVVTSNDKDLELHSLNIVGNAALITNSQQLQKDDSWASNISTQFTPEHIYISNGSYRKNSQLAVLSLANPLKPQAVENILLPTQLNQLHVDEVLLGTGNTSVKITDNISQYLGTITALDVQGQEINSLLLGTDYRHYSSNVALDDQTLSLDSTLNRLFVPYSLRQPWDAESLPFESHRLTLANYSTQGINETHTFSLLDQPQRTLSISEPLAFSFSDEFIYQLLGEGSWQANKIFDGELPESIYYSRKQNNHVQKLIRPDSIVLKLMDDAEGVSGNVLDEKQIARKGNGFCHNEKVYFDQDRILIVQTKPLESLEGYDYEKCISAEGAELSGYQIGSDSLNEIQDQTELKQLYQLILWNMHCVLDPENHAGERLGSLPANTSSMSCYTYKQYNELRNELNTGI